MSKIIPSFLFLGVMAFAVQVSAVTGPTVVQTEHIVLWYSGVDKDTAIHVAETAQSRWANSGDETVHRATLRLAWTQNDGLALRMDKVNLPGMTTELRNLVYGFLQGVAEDALPDQKVTFEMSDGMGDVVVLDGFQPFDQPTASVNEEEGA